MTAPPAAFKPGDRVRVKADCETVEWRGFLGTVTRLKPNLNVRLDGMMVPAMFMADEIEPVPPSDPGDGLRERIADDFAASSELHEDHYEAWLKQQGYSPSSRAQWRERAQTAEATIATLRAENEALQAVLVSKGAENDRLKAENARLIRAIGEHVTVRGEYYERATRAEAECERMKGAVEAENEACAALVGDYEAWRPWWDGQPVRFAMAAAIRARRASSALAAIKGETT